MLLFGLMGPFSAAFMNRFGIRNVAIAALVLISSGLLGSFFMTQTWQLVLLWGVVVGFGTGMTALVLGATVATRWFSKRRGLVIGLLNAYPYTSGHLMVMPVRHVADLEELTADESAALWAAATDAVRAIKAAYRPEGINLGLNLGRAAGAGVPGHLHVHVVPRWNGDTNFMTTVAETRVLPESLGETDAKLRAAWP